jgi:4'-phosphopantetheinyl transferase
MELTAQPTTGVWVRLRRLPVGRRPRSRHPDDLAAASGMARWRGEELLASRALLRELLRDVAPRQQDARLRIAPGGKPELRDVGISISHDGMWTAVAVAPGRAVGVDVQRPTRDASPRLVARCAGRHADVMQRRPAPERDRELAWIWTVQEACVKADGTGLGGRPWTIDVEPGARCGWWGDLRWAALRSSSPVPLSCAWEDDER